MDILLTKLDFKIENPYYYIPVEEVDNKNSISLSGLEKAGIQTSTGIAYGFYDSIISFTETEKGRKLPAIKLIDLVGEKVYLEILETKEKERKLAIEKKRKAEKRNNPDKKVETEAFAMTKDEEIEMLKKLAAEKKAQEKIIESKLFKKMQDLEKENPGKLVLGVYYKEKGDSATVQLVSSNLPLIRQIEKEGLDCISRVLDEKPNLAKELKYNALKVLSNAYCTNGHSSCTAKPPVTNINKVIENVYCRITFALSELEHAKSESEKVKLEANLVDEIEQGYKDIAGMSVGISNPEDKYKQNLAKDVLKPIIEKYGVISQIYKLKKDPRDLSSKDKNLKLYQIFEEMISDDKLFKYISNSKYIKPKYTDPVIEITEEQKKEIIDSKQDVLENWREIIINMQDFYNPGDDLEKNEFVWKKIRDFLLVVKNGKPQENIDYNLRVTTGNEINRFIAHFKVFFPDRDKLSTKKYILESNDTKKATQNKINEQTA